MERKIESAPVRDVTVDFIDTPLDDVLAYLADTAQIPILIDKQAFEEDGTDPGMLITMNLAGTAAAQRLSHAGGNYPHAGLYAARGQPHRHLRTSAARRK